MTGLPPSLWDNLGKNAPARPAAREFHQVNTTHLLHPWVSCHPRMGARQDTVWRETGNILDTTAGRKENIRQATKTTREHSSISWHVYLLSHKYIALEYRKVNLEVSWRPCKSHSSPRSSGKQRSGKARCKAPMHWERYWWLQEMLQPRQGRHALEQLSGTLEKRSRIASRYSAGEQSQGIQQQPLTSIKGDFPTRFVTQWAGHCLR